jgi:hypothetical protein
MRIKFIEVDSINDIDLKNDMLDDALNGPDAVILTDDIDICDDNVAKYHITDNNFFRDVSIYLSYMKENECVGIIFIDDIVDMSFERAIQILRAAISGDGAVYMYYTERGMVKPLMDMIGYDYSNW